MKDFYYILGLYPNCSLDEIKAAYRKLSKKLHPDLNQGDEYFERRFRDIKEAFETLRDPQKRRIYDEQLAKFKSAKPAEEFRQQGTSARSYNNTTDRPRSQPSSAKSGKVRRRGPGVGLSLTLIALAIIIGIYLFRSFTGPERKKLPVYTGTAAAPQPVHKKHRHKHQAKNLIAAKTEVKSFDTAKIAVVKPDIMKPMTIKPEPLSPPHTVKPEPLRPMMAKTRPDSNQAHSDYLYTTYVHPNVTGIVPLRQHDRFNSSVIADIPANSRVFVLERGSTYYRVFYDNSIGFVPKWALLQK
ncbi:MAG TPA: J domain-containing protein [Mucilaginibacter sp.]|jgi:hypothetical protein|nr:J domain-containing protein [Mucilaginibacter sp.]